MEKKYKNGLVLGKMFPPTKGHLYLIEQALKECEFLNVIVCYNQTQNVTGDQRTSILSKCFAGENVKVHQLCDDGMPQSDEESESLDEFYSHWVPAVYRTIQDIDVVFTSEMYGDDFGRYLGVDHVMIDQKRKVVSISGTKVRENPFKNWDYIPDETKYLYVKRVALMGPESTGKSTLSKLLSEHYKTQHVEEYGREVYERNGNHVDLEDFIEISTGRQKLEEESILKSNKLIVCDTEDITTYIFSKMYYPDTYKEIEGFFTERIESHPKYDVYILLKPDCDGVDDGARSFLDHRDKHYQDIKEHLEMYGCNYVEVEGSWENRFNESVNVIDALLK